MVSMGVTRPARGMLRDLIAARDASLHVQGGRVTAALARARRQSTGLLVSIGRALLVSLLFLAGLASRHGLVLAGLASFVLAASLYSPIAGLCVAGVSFLFLELRRR